jgi:hypothetical protein
MQFGAFGLLALFFIWLFWKGIPILMTKGEETIGGIVEKHALTVEGIVKDHKETVATLTADLKSTVTTLTEEFREESEKCREERIAVHKEAAAERDKMMSRLEAIGKPS